MVFNSRGIFFVFFPAKNNLNSFTHEWRTIKEKKATNNSENERENKEREEKERERESE